MSRFYDECTIAAPGNMSPRRLPIGAPRVSWELSASGSLSGFVRLADLREADLDTDLKGYWIEYDTSAGRWGGVITGRPTTGHVAEIVAQGFAGLLHGRVITNADVVMSGSAGGIAKRAIIQAGGGTATFVSFGSIDEGGGPISLELTGDVGQDLLPQIAEAGDVEWMIDADRVFSLARKLGRDRSAMVRLVEDRHIVEARMNDDFASVAAGASFRVQSELSQVLQSSNKPALPVPPVQPPNNPPVPTPPTPPPTSPTVSEEGAPSFWEQFGPQYLSGLGLPAGADFSQMGMQTRRQASQAVQENRQTIVIDPPGVANPAVTNSPSPTWSSSAIGIGAHNPAVPSQRHATLPTIPGELTLANIDDCFLAFHVGDTIRIDLGSIGISGRFRVITKGLDVSSQALTVAGELLKDV